MAMASISLVARGPGEESVSGTPAAVATPRAVDRAAIPVRAGDLVIVNDEHVILQPEPAYSADRVAMLPQLQPMEATGRTAVRDGERWLELRYPVTGAVGWVSDRWLIPMPDDAGDAGTPIASPIR